MKQPAFYIMASQRNGTLYTGGDGGFGSPCLAASARRRRWLHERYGCKLLVWYEVHDEMTMAITREKRIKDGSRKSKLALLEVNNSQWRNLFEGFASG